MNKEYAERTFEGYIRNVMHTLGDFVQVDCDIEVYLAALKKAKDEIDDWLDCNIEAAEADVKRKNGE